LTEIRAVFQQKTVEIKADSF